MAKQDLQNQEHLVESWLDQNPSSTVVQIRDGVEHETGIRIERVQARVDKIGRRRVVTKATGDYGRTTYSLGDPRRVVRAGGIEARIVITEGHGVELVLAQHKSDLDDPEIHAYLAGVLDAVRRCLTAKALPMVRERAADLGLLGGPIDDATEWLSTLSAMQEG